MSGLGVVGVVVGGGDALAEATVQNEAGRGSSGEGEFGCRGKR